jgi:hypothetical protein
VCLGDGLVARWRCIRAGHERTGLTVCSAISEGLLPADVVLPAVLVALVAPAPLAGAGSVPQLPALCVEAVALPAVITEADLERPAAVETHDLDEIDQVRVVGHDAGEANRAPSASLAKGYLPRSPSPRLTARLMTFRPLWGSASPR